MTTNPEERDLDIGQLMNMPLGEVRDYAEGRARTAANTIQGVLLAELLPEGILESAAGALENARNALLAIEVRMSADPAHAERQQAYRDGRIPVTPLRGSR